MKGDAAKARAATAMNDRSSRAHSLLLLSLTQTPPGANAGKVITLALYIYIYNPLSTPLKTTLRSKDCLFVCSFCRNPSLNLTPV